MSAFWKDLLREIKNTPGRFISLIIISLLGAASLVGIQATSIDMRDIADKTYKSQSLYDLQIKSTTGFDDEDIRALADTGGVATLMPTYILDAYINLENENRAARTYALPDGINDIQILDGRLPENAGECVVDARLPGGDGVQIGESLRLGLDNMDDYFDIFASDTFTVVGVVSSPLYISFQRGNTTLGDGSLSYYIYLHPDAYTLDVYTDIYLLMDGSRDMDNLTQAYYGAADEWEARIGQTGAARVQAKKDELSDAQKEIDDGWAEYFDGVDELEAQVADGRRELEDAQAKLTDARAELEDGQRTLDREIAEGLAEIDRQTGLLASGQSELNARSAELEAGQAQINEARAQLDEALAGLNLKGPQGVSPELDAYYEQIYASLAELDVKQAELDAGWGALAAARQTINNGYYQIAAAREALEAGRIEAQSEIDDGWAEYHEGLEEYDEGVLTLETEQADALLELADALRELEEAQEQLDGAPTPEWYIFTREDGVSFDSYYQDTLRLEKIGYVFPLVFFLVAIMVSLTTMSRMVENHRTQIGVYKALGYHSAAIVLKYVIYAFGAGFIGGVAGVALGSRFFPLIISDAYGHLYNMPPVDTPIPAAISVISVLSSVLAVVVVTLITYLSAMRGAPALLMRPKPPAKGKRVLLERVKFIWNRLGFFSKVTARNVFRYKRRFIMTLAGVAGCSALLLTAFGLRDSIADVTRLQYGVITKYDAQAYLKDITTNEQRDELRALLPADYLYIREEAVTAGGEDRSISATLTIPERAEELNNYLNLYDPKTDEPVAMTSRSVLITEKLSRGMGAKAGDSFTMTLDGGATYTAEISGVVDNYIQHYIYMSPDIYKEIFGAEPYANSAMIFNESSSEFAAPLLKNDNVRALMFIDELMARVSDSTDALGIVTVVLIILACALALVVLFNLTNINISERLRELATMKVLGLYDGELAMYIYRENGLVTFIGIILGLFGGIFLHAYVLTSVEIDVLRFPLTIRAVSYIYAVVLSAAFAIFVNLVMSRKLKRIDMVESLKNVE